MKPEFYILDLDDNVWYGPYPSQNKAEDEVKQIIEDNPGCEHDWLVVVTLKQLSVESKIVEKEFDPC